MTVKRTIDRKYFFDRVRKSIFGGQLSETQVANMDAILDAIEAVGISNRFWIGAILGTARWEVGAKMAPVREGFATTDRGARNAVAQLYREGKIKKNYAVPDAVTGKSYYGRGYPQTTHKENYLKSGEALGLGDLFVKNPDLLLEPSYAALAMVRMMETGGYRAGKSLPSMLGQPVPTFEQMIDSRDIINGDKTKKVSPKSKNSRTIGQVYADYAMKFADAVRLNELPEPEVASVEVKPEPEMPALETPAQPAYIPLWKRFLDFFS